MKMINTKLLILTSLPVAMLVVGCNKQSGTGSDYSSTNDSSMDAKEMATNAWQKTKEATTNAVEKTKEVTTNAWEKTKTATVAAWTDIKESLGSTNDYTYDKKDEFVSKANADLAALDQKIKDWSDNAANASDSMKADMQAKLKTLNDKRAALDQKLDDVKNATAANWDAAKTTFKNSYEDVKDSLKNMWQ